MGVLVQREPPYRQIATEIRRRIEAGELRPGDRVPSARQITRDWGVAIATATKALAQLRTDGLVTAEPGIGTVVATREHPARRGEAVLTRERIVRTAMALLDAEGLPALSMRRIAAELNVATMTLYRQITGRDDLVVLLLDACMGDDPLPDPAPPGWRAQLELVTRRQWAGYRRHPWLARLISVTRPRLAPRAMVHTERMMGALHGAGLDLPTALNVSVALVSLVQGLAANLDTELEEQRDSGVTSDEWMRGQERQFLDLMTSGRYPLLARVASIPDFDSNLDILFEISLKLALDGIATLLREKRTPRRDGGGSGGGGSGGGGSGGGGSGGGRAGRAAP